MAALAALLGGLLPSAPLVKSDGRRNRRIQRLGGRLERDRRLQLAVVGHLGGKPFALGADDERGTLRQLELVQRRSATRNERHPGPRSLVEAAEGDAKNRAGRGAQRLWTGRVAAARRERDEGRAESVRGADYSSYVAWIDNMPESDSNRRSGIELRKVGSAEDGDHA